MSTKQPRLVLASDPTDPLTAKAHRRLLDRAAEAYGIAHHYALQEASDAESAHQEALAAALAAVGPGYGAAAIHGVSERLAADLPETTLRTLGDWAAEIDLEVVEDITGANGT
ncbi:hypothetical protein [Streptomyces sp. NPDC001194]|uniref:hypothetical protein n=1 Tax=Streptomyces sp. NPDC001194 TaxID=3364547 RepID=UPI0036BD711D